MPASRFVSKSRIQLPFLEPLPATGKEGRQEGERGGGERGVFVGDSKVEMNCRHQQP